MRTFPSRKNDVITLGPKGVSEVCKIVSARWFLPYAHWWTEVGQPPSTQEVALTGRLSEELRACSASTIMISWAIGDRFSPYLDRINGEVVTARVNNDI
ncbi:hypothetical protein CCP3SC5AM1_2670001 [Gammaproteobacteria bacterium]